MHCIDKIQIFLIGQVAAGADLPGHSRIALQIGFHDAVGFGHAAEQEYYIEQRGMVGQNQLAGAAEPLEAFKFRAQNAGAH